MGGNASANNMLTGGEGGSKKPDFVLTLYVYLPFQKNFLFTYGIRDAYDLIYVLVCLINLNV